MVTLRTSFVFLVITFLSGLAISQDRCVPFGGTVYGWHDGTAWVAEGDFDIGQQTQHVKVRDVNTGVEDHGAFLWGTEKATFDFGNGNGFDLVTEFTSEGINNPAKVYHVNMTGKFANGSGKFKKAWGRFAAQGPYGPGVVLPKGKVTPAEQASMYWIGHYNGILCY
jgi:hypothetical protein